MQIPGFIEGNQEGNPKLIHCTIKLAKLPMHNKSNMLHSSCENGVTEELKMIKPCRLLLLHANEIRQPAKYPIIRLSYVKMK